ncbi:MAG: Gfo/Idh/MocA family oxidoreductase [Acidobacteria bacterium]|nr:Gfo/Idh/MocA family oxidoreductase [Acidobacteriota bacterium]
MNSALSYSRIAGANDRVSLGLIGCGGRGSYVATLFQKSPAVKISAVCDVYGARIDKALAFAQGARSFYDHRKLLEMGELDVVLIGTPDHWHARTAIDALNAGKDVYVEKPLMRTRDEGPLIVKAARVNDRICQVGLQQRSGWPYLRARDEFVRAGKLGKITLARTFWHSGPPRPLNRDMKEKPSNLDWARFLGPVKWRDWDPAQYFNFRAFLDYNGGKITDFFTHWVDAVHMMLEIDNPVAVMSAGGIYGGFNDGRTAPDNVYSLVEYPSEVTVTFECGAFAPQPEYGIELCGTEGRLFVNRNRLEYHSHDRGAPPVADRRPGDITLDHVNNFLECCRTRKRPNADVHIGQRSTQVSLLAVQAYVEKRRIRFDPAREEVLPL